MAETTDPEAPHGRDEQGVPLAPFGLKTDGTPRISNRGRTAKAPAKKATPNTKSGRTAAKRTHQQTRSQLVELVGMLTTPLAAAASSPPMVDRLGPDKAMALCGSAVIIDAHAEPAADALIQLAQSKPGVLAWMDKVEEKAPYLALLQVGASLGRALVGNFMRPSPELAEAGRKMVAIRAVRMAQAIEEEYASLGLVPDEMAEAYAAADIPQQRAA
ncbi:hypothetical protein ACWC9H_35350 [Streptomyces sp. NPDC001251]